MQPRNRAVRKGGSPDEDPGKLLSVRSALVLALAVLAALGGAALLYAAHRPVALVVLGAVAVCAAALKFFDSMIELSALDTRSGLRHRGFLFGGRAAVAAPAWPPRRAYPASQPGPRPGVRLGSTRGTPRLPPPRSERPAPAPRQQPAPPTG
jgi:hypothetical protein